MGVSAIPYTDQLNSPTSAAQSTAAIAVCGEWPAAPLDARLINDSSIFVPPWIAGQHDT